MSRKCAFLLWPTLALAALVSCVSGPRVKDPNVQPGDLVGYTTWTRVNSVPLTGDPFNVLGQVHGGGAGIREIYVNDLGKAVSAAGSGFPYPVGTVLVKETYEETATGGKGAVTQVTAMVKRVTGYNPADGNWEYILLEPDLTVSSRGQLSACITCHAAASDRDFIFNNGRTMTR